MQTIAETCVRFDAAHQLGFGDRSTHVSYLNFVTTHTAVPLLHSHLRGFCRRGTSNTALHRKLGLHRNLLAQVSHVNHRALARSAATRSCG